MPRKKSEHDELVERVKQLEQIVEGLVKTILNLATGSVVRDSRYTGL